MAFERRLFMKGVAATAGASLLTPHIPTAEAATAKPTGQVPGIYRTKVGDIQVTSIFDGGMQMGSGILLKPDEEEVNRLKDKSFIKEDYIPGYLNTFVVNTGSKLILIDTGAGDYAPTTGNLVQNLKAAGYQPDQFDEILLTHAHPDHVKGLLNKAGEKVFARATVKISQEEHSFWFNDDNLTKMNDKKSAFKAARANLSAYKASKQLETFKLGADLGQGIISADLHGHTPGHSGFRISSGKDQLLIWGDIVHMQALQFTHPEWSLTFDINPEQAIKSRQKILDEVATDKIRIGGMHLSFPGLGHVEKSASGYAMVPQMWEASV